MSVFDQYADTPDQILFEGQEIVLKFDRLSASTARISWNIPRKSSGCNSDNPPAYDGIVITLDNANTRKSILPSNEVVYIADPTANKDLHAGDNIGDALIIGAFYGDRETTHVDITGLQGLTPYYVSAHAVDAQLRYHHSGVHAYSQDYGNEEEQGTTAKQNIRIGEPDVGVLASDLTGLVAGESYTVDMILDNERNHIFDIAGDDALTYEDLVAEWTRQVYLIDNPLMSATPPNAGAYHFDSTTNTLYLWDGLSQIPQPVLLNDFQPTIPAIDALWYNGVTLSKWDGATWIPQVVFNVSFDPIKQACDQFWYDGTTLYEWTGTVWVDKQLLTGLDPSLPPSLPKSTHWYNENDFTLYKLGKSCVTGKECDTWVQTIAQLWDEDPTNPALDQYWFDETSNTVFKFDGTTWVQVNATLVSDDLPLVVPTGSIYYVENDMELFEEQGGVFVKVPVFVWDKNPMTPTAGDLWWDEDDAELFQWSGRQSTWVQITPFFIQGIDPKLATEIEPCAAWFDGSSYKSWDGSEWHDMNVIEHNSNPHDLTNGVYWKDGDQFKELVASNWATVSVTENASDPVTPSAGDFWYDTTTNALYQFNGITYIAVTYSPTSNVPALGFTYYNTTEAMLKEWNGYGWINSEPMFTVKLEDTKIALESTLRGSCARVATRDFTKSSLFAGMTPIAEPYKDVIGTDGLQGIPSFQQQDVGTDGSSDERRELADSIRHQLGYPTVDVELTKQQFDYAIDGAIESLRKRSGMAYKRGYYFMDIEPHQQNYVMTDKCRGFDKIVSVVQIHRVKSSFLSNAEGQGLYGQVALQQMYQMGSFDLVSYHLVSQYIETMNQMFAADIMFTWNEDSRNLMIFKHFYKAERVLMEVVTERTEQNILKDRYLKGWVEKYAMAQSRIMLSEVRGKYAALPGAGGGTSLNAQDLAARADADLADLYQQLDDYVIDNPEEYGGQFIIG